jgi:glycosyltransferase involved in cell wall biosynthesis
MPVVSVLMTSYNREKYIAEAISSVLSSSFTDFELIICDDCSTDRTVDIARDFAEKDKRIRVFVNENNLGDYFNRNRAASYASGKYLKYIDSDDMIYPHGLQVMVEAMEKFPEADFGTQHMLREDVKPYPFMISPEQAYKDFYFTHSFLQSGPTGTIIKRSAFEKVHGFSGKRYVGDIELWLRLSAKAPVVKFQPGLIWWRQHDEQEISNENKELVTRKMLDFYIAQENLCAPECPMNSSDRKKAMRLLKKRQARFVLHLMLKRFRVSEAIKVKKQSHLRLINLVSAVINKKD